MFSIQSLCRHSCLLWLFVLIGMGCSNPLVANEGVTVVETLYDLNLNMKSLAGENVEFAKFKGKVVLFVNVASRCGYTPQYKDLQELHKQYREKGLVIVGVPCNQFGKQEPGTADEIAQFCQQNYGVEFQMLEKVDVNGADQSELFRFLTAAAAKPAGSGPVKWNFEKFLVDKEGKPVARFRSAAKPTSDELVQAIQTALQP